MVVHKAMRVCIKFDTYIYLAVLLFLIPIQWLAAWLIAVICHEFCHYLAVYLCGGEIFSLTVGIGGANMESSNLSKKRRLVAILAGPIGGQLPVILSRWFPRLALCCWLLSIYNMLPILPLDGGQALQILMKNKRGFYVFEMIIIIVFILCGVYASIFLHLGLLPIVIALGIWMKYRKRPCKEDYCKVQ